MVSEEQGAASGTVYCHVSLRRFGRTQQLLVYGTVASARSSRIEGPQVAGAKGTPCHILLRAQRLPSARRMTHASAGSSCSPLQTDGLLWPPPCPLGPWAGLPTYPCPSTLLCCLCRAGTCGTWRWRMATGRRCCSHATRGWATASAGHSKVGRRRVHAQGGGVGCTGGCGYE